MKKLQQPELLFIMAVCGCILSLYSLTAYFLLAATAIFITFPKKFSVFVFLIFCISFSASEKTAFVLDIKYDRTKPTYITTKGYFTGDYNFNIGDMIVADFKRNIGYSSILPKISYEIGKKYSSYQAPFISRLLKKRTEHSAKLFYGSKGLITTAQTHIFAVKDYIPDSLRDEYIITGLAHLLAMSGFHTGIFIGGLILILSFIPFKVRVLFIIPALIVLIPISGFAVTVIRAVCFALIYFIAYSADLKVNSIKFILFLAGIIMIFSPYSLYSISFLLSFSAVLGIILFAKNKNASISDIIFAGTAATAFTLPIQLYFFGTANILSIFTTVIMTPFVWLQMLFGLLSLIFTEWMIPPLSYIELIISGIMNYLYKISWYTLYIIKPNLFSVILIALFTLLIIRSRFKYMIFIIFLIPIFLTSKDDVLLAPKLPPSAKGYILKNDNTTEIYYQGMRAPFVRYMLPAAARLGVKTFDYGKIRIFDAENLYLKVKNNSLSGTVCVNNDSGECSYVFMTRSNTVKKPKEDKIYIIYKNELKTSNILTTHENDVEIKLKK